MRAKFNGQRGANGELYKAGQFIATTDKPKGIPRRKGSGKQQIEPYVWEKPPADDLRSLWEPIRDFTLLDGGQLIPLHFRQDPTCFEMASKLYPLYRINEKRLEEACRLYNSGQRWTPRSWSIRDPLPAEE